MQTIRFVIIWLFVSLLACCNAARAQVVINEYSTANVTNVTDNYGQYEDWFELYNAGSSSVSLTGYYLTNKASEPMKWQFPSGNIAAGSVLRIWASERNTVVGGNYHMNFKLQQTKPHVILLSDPSGVMVDSVRLRRHQPNHSWGRITDGAPTWGVFTTPTSNALNSTQTSKTRYALMPAFSLPGGFYSGTQNVSITTADAGTMYYTVDGSEPAATSPIYSGAISVSQTTVVKAFVVPTDAALLPSFYEFHTYLINESHTLPVVSVSGDDIETLLNGNGWIKPITAIEYYDFDQTLAAKAVGRADAHGNDSWAYDQRGFDYVCKDQLGYNHYLQHKIFPRSDRDKFQRVMFKAGASDNYPTGSTNNRAHMRDAFVHDYSEKVGLKMDGRRLEHCAVYVNGEYWGLYEVRERMDDSDFTEYYYDQPEDSIDVLRYWGGLNVIYGNTTDWNNFYNFVMNNPMTDPVAYETVKDWMSFSNLIDYCIYNTYIVNTDWINWNTMWWRGHAATGDNKKWHYVLWDEDNTFNLGQNFSGWQTTGPTADPCDLANNFPQSAGPNQATMAILEKLLTNDEFHEMYINRYADLINGKLSCDSVLQHLDWMEQKMLPEMVKQCQRWGGSVAQWQGNVQNIRDFMETRCTFVAGAITGCYDVTGPYQLTVIIDPPGAGTVKLNSFTPPGFPYTGTYFGSSAAFTMNLHLEQTPVTDYIFGYWIPGATITADPGILSDTLSVTLTGNDTIIAHFKYWPAVGVYATDEMDINILPTVSSDLLMVNFNNLPEGISTLRLFNLTGQQVADIATPVLGLTTGRRTTSLKTLGLAPGMYLVELTAGSHKQIQKIVYQPD